MSSFDPATTSLCIRIAVGLIFLTAAIGKWRHFDALAGVLENYRLLPAWAVKPVQAFLPMVELGVAVGLLYMPEVGASLAAVLLLSFAAAMAINLHRGRSSIDCGCHQTALRQHLRWALVWRNCGLALLALLAMLAPGRSEATSMLASAAAGLCLFLLYTAMNSLWALGPVPPRRRIRIVGGST